MHFDTLLGFSCGSAGKGSACNVGDLGLIPGLSMRETWVQSLGQEDPLEKEMAAQHTPVFLPGEFHGQRSLVGYSPW